MDFELIEKYRKDNNLARIFGFILYSVSNSNIVKVLKDDDYWNGFHEDSDGWIVFSIKPKSGMHTLPDFPDGVFGMMVPIWN